MWFLIIGGLVLTGFGLYFVTASWPGSGATDPDLSAVYYGILMSVFGGTALSIGIAALGVQIGVAAARVDVHE